MNQTTDKAGEKYWSSFWNIYGLPKPINIKDNGINNFPIQKFHETFKSIFSDDDKGKKILEIGCGNSVWLPYFAKQFELDVYGIDYSPLGVETSELLLKRENVNGTIIQSDLFNPPAELLNKFDFVISLGVVEHFTDTRNVIENISKFLKKDGLIITTVPNLTSINGYLQKKFFKPVYDIHVPLNKENLENAHKIDGLRILKSKYLVSFAISIVLENAEKKAKNYQAKKIIALYLSRICKIFWLIEKTLKIKIPEKRTFAGNILTVAIKN